MRVIHVLRKPLSEGTVAANTLRHGTGGLNIDASRIASPGEEITTHSQSKGAANRRTIFEAGSEWAGIDTHQTEGQKLGRWPANVILQHLDACVEQAEGVTCAPDCPVAKLDEQSGVTKSTGGRTVNISTTSTIYGGGKGLGQAMSSAEVRGDPGFGDTGGASRFYKQIGGSDE